MQLAEAEQQRHEVQLVARAVVNALSVAEAAAQVAGQLPHVVGGARGGGQHASEPLLRTSVHVVEPRPETESRTQGASGKGDVGESLTPHLKATLP